ncbi:hypothetical protein JCM8097_001580 [Rhodosporidiobolus ruineniae]
MANSKNAKAGDKEMSPKVDGDNSKAYIQRLPDELICSIARFYNPSIPFELGHFVLARDFTRGGRNELRALAATCTRFSRLLRPTIYRNLVFQDQGRKSNTVQLYAAKEIHEYVKELYWQPSYLYNDMSPVFIPILKNLKYLILAFLPQSVPDEFISDDYGGLTTLRRSFTEALKQIPQLEALEIPFWERAEDEEFRFTKALPKLNSISVGDWQEWEAFENPGKLTTVKWLIHPDLDLEEGVLDGFLEVMMPHAKVLQFAAHSGWGRTDLPEKLPEQLKQASWYKDIADHPMESMTFHGFNPITSYKKEWATLLPAFLSLLQPVPNLSQVVFMDVPSLRNDDRVPLDWDNVDKLEGVENLQISLATDEEMKRANADDEGEGDDGEEEQGGGGAGGGGGADEHQTEQHESGGEEAEERDKPELSERISPEEIYTLLSVFPNLKSLTLANFLRCKRPDEHGASDSAKEGDKFAEERFVPAARDFIRELGLYDRFQGLRQIVFRSVEAELAVRFRRTHDDEHHGENEDGWIEELRRLY